jgi:hypothetical protein
LAGEQQLDPQELTMKTYPLTAALAVAAALCLAGCGGSGSTTTAASGGVPASGGKSAAGDPATGTSAPAAPTQGKKIDVCSALPLAEVSQIIGTKFTTTKSSSVENLVFECEYHGPGGALLQISVVTEDGPHEFDIDVSALKGVGHAPNKVAGVGDEAFSEPDPQGNAGAVGAAGFASYGAVFGATYIKIGGLTYVNADQGKQLVEKLHSS